MSGDLDHRFMGLALSLGRRGLGHVWPNPNVGCVVVREGRVIGRGWTADGGRPHAETRALDGVEAAGATVYVTLEPCAHHGKTPPCAEALIAAGVARVVIATGDPDPRVAGKGIAMLKAAGITVDLGLRGAEARADMAGFLSRVERGRPFVTLKVAGSLDGRIATATGESQWITGPEARRMVHGMRARHDAVLVGAGTVRADNPALTVREMGARRQPVRVVASRKLDFDGGRLLEDIGDAPLWLVHGTDASEAAMSDWAARGAKLMCCDAKNRHIDPGHMMQCLGEAGLTRIFCEGGGSLAASLMGAGVVDEVIYFTAGLALGAEGTPSVGALGVDKLADAPRFELVETQAVGADILHRWAARRD